MEYWAAKSYQACSDSGRPVQPAASSAGRSGCPYQSAMNRGRLIDARSITESLSHSQEVAANIRVSPLLATGKLDLFADQILDDISRVSFKAITERPQEFQESTRHNL